jgi:hypothetical protein
MANGYTTGVRAALNQKGISNDRISYDPAKGGVMVDNKAFMTPGKVYNGSAYTDQTGFNNAWNQFSKPQPQSNTGGMLAGYGQKPNPQVTGFTSPSTGYTPPAAGYTPPSTGYAPQQAAPSVDQRINDLYSMLQNQQAFDPYSTPAYAAAQAQAQRQMQQNIRGMQEAYGSAGMGRSSGLGERALGIQNDATNYLMTQVIPQIEAQNAAQRQQDFQNAFSLLTPQQQQQQFAEQTAQARGQLTGSFLAPEAQQTIQALNALKAQTEQNWQVMTPEQRVAARAQGDQLRASLQGMQVDPNLFGAGVTSTQAVQNIGRVGTPTLAAQGQQFEQATTLRQLDRADFESDRQFEFAKGQQEWENNFQTGQFNWQKAQRLLAVCNGRV